MSIRLVAVWRWLCGYRWRRITLAFISYEKADLLLRKQGEVSRYQSPQWRIAKEEDTNQNIGYVNLEWVEFVNKRGKVRV